MKQILTINSDTFIWTEGSYGLLYDSRMFIAYKFVLTPQISEICNKLLNPDNLYSVAIDMEDIDIDTKGFIANITQKGLGCLHGTNKKKYLISFPPLLNIQRSWEHIKSSENKTYAEILPYLSSVTIYTGGVCPDTEYYKQTIYPISSKNSLPADKILEFLSSLGSPYITDIRIVFSSIEEYSVLNELNVLLDGLKIYGKFITLYVRAEESANKDIMNVLASSGLRTTVLYVRSPKKWLSRPEHVSTRFIFLVSSESECETTEAWCRDNKIDFFDLIPIFNGNNKDFFLKNMFLSEQDILRSHLERRTVFAHMVVNTEFFGHMTVMPDGKVYADPTEQPIGNMEDSVYDLITSELEHNTAWRKTRNMLEKCHICIYRYLCPSPSAYEKIMDIDCICTN